MLITFANTKGGVGKSTLASHLAIWLFDRGYRVALLDADRQQSAAQWVSNAEPGIKVVVATDVDEITRARTELLKSHDIVVADSPGEGNDAAHAITMLTDMAIVPLQPSRLDIRAIKDALKYVRLAQEMNHGIKPIATIVLTLTAKGDVQTKRLRDQLQKLDLGATIAVSEIRRLNALRDACDSSVTRLKYVGSQAAAHDLESLFEELLGHMFSMKKVGNE